MTNLAKTKIEFCANCNKDTPHKVKDSMGIDHGRGSGFKKYTAYTCLLCLKKRFKK